MYNQTMNRDTWDRSLPPQILLGGNQQFTPPLSDPTQSWMISTLSTNPATLRVESQSNIIHQGIRIQVEFIEDEGSNPSSPDPGPPTLDEFSWDWIGYHFLPLPNIEVRAINWVPDPRVICGIYQLHNQHTKPREITLKLTCQGEFRGNIQITSPTLQGRTILSGKSPHHNLALFMSGSTISPSGKPNQLKSIWELDPDQSAEIRWILVFCDKNADSHPILDNVIQLDWDGEVARRKIHLNHQLQIITGNADLDFSLAVSQRQANLNLSQLLLQETSGQTDHHLSPLHYWQLLLALTPLESSPLERLISAAFRNEQGSEPNFPLLAEILLRAYQAGLHPDLMEAYLPMIAENLNLWFSDTIDKDGDGVPELPRDISLLFGIDPSLEQEGGSWLGGERGEGYLENPGVAALLLNEIRQMNFLNEINTNTSSMSNMHQDTDSMTEFILASWNEDIHQFQSRDFQSHLSREGFIIEEFLSTGWNSPQISLPYPSRLLMQLPRPEGADYFHDPLVTFHGVDWRGRYRVEEISLNNINWEFNAGWGMTETIFSHLDHCVVQGLTENQSIQIKAPQSDSQDLRLTLPLLLEELPDELGQKLVTKSISDKDRFWSDYGLKAYPKPGPSLIPLPLNILVMQGLIRRGFMRFARDLYLGWIAATSGNLNEKGTLFAAWDSNTGKGMGKPNLVEGCLPIGLFLDLLEVRFQGTRELIVGEKSPHFFPVQLIYKGVEITLLENETILQRPGEEPIFYSREHEAIIDL
jgi:hypothetical protein